MPPGDYVVKAWQEKLGVQPSDGVKVNVESGKAVKAEFPAFQAK